MDLKEKMRSGKLYNCVDDALIAEQTSYLEILYDFNQTRPSEGEKRQEILKKSFLPKSEKKLLHRTPASRQLGKSRSHGQ